MNLSLNSFEIKQFRGLVNLKLDDLGRFNLLVGSNNSGKTSVLEALALYSNPLYILDWFNLARRREIKSSRVSMIDSFAWFFPMKKDKKPSYMRMMSQGQYEANYFRATYEAHSKTELVDENRPYFGFAGDKNAAGFGVGALASSGDNSDLFNLIKGFTIDINVGCGWYSDNQTKYQEIYTYWENEKQEFSEKKPSVSLPIQFLSPFSHRTEQVQVQALSELSLNGLKDGLVEMLQILEPDLNDIEILSKDGSNPTIYIDHKNTGMSPLSMFGDGLRKALTFALAVPYVENGILLIDEIETSIHKSAFQEVFKWLMLVSKKYNFQIFATTHSLEAVDAILASENDKRTEDVVVYHLQTENGASKAKRMSGDLLHRLRYNRGLDIR